VSVVMGLKVVGAAAAVHCLVLGYVYMTYYDNCMSTRQYHNKVCRAGEVRSWCRSDIVPVQILSRLGELSNRVREKSYSKIEF